MKISEINQKSAAELEALVSDTRKQIADISIEMRTKQVSNIKQLKSLKKTVARALTIQRQQHLTKEENNA